MILLSLKLLTIEDLEVYYHEDSIFTRNFVHTQDSSELQRLRSLRHVGKVIRKLDLSLNITLNISFWFIDIHVFVSLQIWQSRHHCEAHPDLPHNTTCHMKSKRTQNEPLFGMVFAQVAWRWPGQIFLIWIKLYTPHSRRGQRIWQWGELAVKVVGLYLVTPIDQIRTDS